jgi:hypothetical protein
MANIKRTTTAAHSDVIDWKAKYNRVAKHTIAGPLIRLIRSVKKDPSF